MSANNDTLNILSWNAQSIANQSKKVELGLLLKHYQIDIACIQETYLNSSSKIYMEDYKIYRSDRDSHGGGVAILVQKNIQHRAAGTIDTVSVENISIEVTIGHRILIVTSAYNPQPTPHFKDDLVRLSQAPSEIIILGDLNAKHTSWRCATFNSAGKQLREFIDSSEYILLSPESHTHYPHSGATPSTIDLAITNTILVADSPTALDDWLISDHCPILYKLNTSTSQVEETRFNYMNANWEEYRNVLISDIPYSCISTRSEIDQAIDRLTSSMVNARNASIPKAKTGNQINAIAADTKNAIIYKNRLNRQWQRCNIPSVKCGLKTAVNIAGKLVKDLTARDRNANWHKFLKKVDRDPKKLWRVSKSLRGKRSPLPPSLWHNNTKITTDQDKADALAEIFEKSHTITLNNTHPHDAKVLNFITKFSKKIHKEFDDICEEELLSAIGSLKPLKAPGNDSIMNIMIKNLPSEAIALLSNIFNACMSINYWPTAFKEAKVVPIHKAGKDSSKAENYRPISLLNTIGKLFEKILHLRISKFVEDNSILNKEQFGFRKQHSSSHQILRVTRHIRKEWNLRRSTGMVLFDIEKAFDSVWHDGLIFKLNKMGFPKYICAMMKEFTSRRSFRVHINSEKSQAKNIPAGLPQGSILSPLLYCIYVSDLKFLNHTHSAGYADDTAIYVSANRTTTICKNLQKSLIKTEKFFDKWKIKINALKTQAIIFPFNGQKIRDPVSQLNLCGSPIAYSNVVNYLGVALDKKLRFKQHLENARVKANRSMAALYPLIGRKSSLNTKNKMKLYKSIIRPIMTYASPVWVSAAISNRKQLQTMQNKCLKLIHRLPRRFPTDTLHLRTEMPTIIEFVTKLNGTFDSKCAESDYDLVRALAD